MIEYESYKSKQFKICGKSNINPDILDEDTILGIADNVCDGIQPINALRHPAEGPSNGWCLWTGTELSKDSNFLKPFHTKHLIST